MAFCFLGNKHVKKIREVLHLLNGGIREVWAIEDLVWRRECKNALQLHPDCNGAYFEVLRARSTQKHPISRWLERMSSTSIDGMYRLGLHFLPWYPMTFRQDAKPLWKERQCPTTMRQDDFDIHMICQHLGEHQIDCCPSGAKCEVDHCLQDVTCDVFWRAGSGNELESQLDAVERRTYWWTSGE